MQDVGAGFCASPTCCSVNLTDDFLKWVNNIYLIVHYAQMP